MERRITSNHCAMRIHWCLCINDYNVHTMFSMCTIFTIYTMFTILRTVTFLLLKRIPFYSKNTCHNSSKVWLCALLCFLCSQVEVRLKIMKPAVRFRRKCYANEEHQRQQVYSHRNFTNEIYSLLKTGSTGYNITELRQARAL